MHIITTNHSLQVEYWSNMLQTCSAERQQQEKSRICVPSNWTLKIPWKLSTNIIFFSTFQKTQSAKLQIPVSRRKANPNKHNKWKKNASNKQQIHNLSQADSAERDKTQRFRDAATTWPFWLLRLGGLSEDWEEDWADRICRIHLRSQLEHRTISKAWMELA